MALPTHPMTAVTSAAGSANQNEPKKKNQTERNKRGQCVHRHEKNKQARKGHHEKTKGGRLFCVNRSEKTNKQAITVLHTPVSAFAFVLFENLSCLEI